MITIGIDLGLTGAVAMIDSKDFRVDIADLPTVRAEEPSAKAKMRLSGSGLARIIRDFADADGKILVFFEDVQARPAGNGFQHGNSIQSQASLMRTRGIVEGAIDAIGGRIQVVQPQTWKNYYGLLKKDKDEALPLAGNLYPAARHLLTRKKDINRADALLIAHWAMRVKQGDPGRMTAVYESAADLFADPEPAAF